MKVKTKYGVYVYAVDDNNRFTMIANLATDNHDRAVAFCVRFIPGIPTQKIKIVFNAYPLSREV